jgi:hypothetical protein
MFVFSFFQFLFLPYKHRLTPKHGITPWRGITPWHLLCPCTGLCLGTRIHLGVGKDVDYIEGRFFFKPSKYHDMKGLIAKWGNLELQDTICSLHKYGSGEGNTAYLYTPAKDLHDSP